MENIGDDEKETEQERLRREADRKRSELRKKIHESQPLRYKMKLKYIKKVEIRGDKGKKNVFEDKPLQMVQVKRPPQP